MRRGATLVEVVVAIGVSAMLTSLVIVYGTGGRQTTALYVDTVKLAQTILRAKSQAVLIYYDPANPICGYGIHLLRGSDQPAYALFRYAAVDGESCDSITSIDTTSARYVEVQRFPLAAGVSFGSTPTREEMIDTIFFLPPDPQTILWNDVNRVKPTGVIDLTVGGGNSRAITITTSGQITY